MPSMCQRAQACRSMNDVIAAMYSNLALGCGSGAGIALGPPSSNFTPAAASFVQLSQHAPRQEAPAYHRHGHQRSGQHTVNHDITLLYYNGTFERY